MVKAEVVYSC